MKLTAKQEKFARLVAEGNTQADAYREAYNALKMADKTVWERASFEASKDKVRTRIEELKKEITKNLDLASQITVERQLKYAQKAVQECLKVGDWNNYLKAMEMQNRLLGLNAPTKTDNTHKMNQSLDDIINKLKNS